MANADTLQMPFEDRPRNAGEPQVAVPSLNIFLGSTPSYSALEVMRQLINLPDLDRRRVALMYLDIDSPPSEVLQFRQEHPGLLKEFDLRISVAHGVLFADQLPKQIANHTYIPTKIPESFDNGAGGIRNNGHVAACTDRTKIVQLLDEALAAVGAIPYERNAKPVSEIQINIVAFLGGGTGSGILPDLAVITRHRVLQLNLKHRLNIFCLLPEHVREATTNDVSWRKSNATATLLELVALSQAKGQRRNDGTYGPYIKYMLTNPYEVRGTTVANEVYLFGRTSMNSAEDAARIVGLDLYTRITNGSGVGFLERSKSVDRRTLGNYDSNGLPTMFGTTCPLEVSFPAAETADAFAKMTASKILPTLAGDLEAEKRALSATELDEVKEWDRALQPTDPPQFTERSFRTAGRDRMDALEARLHKQIDEAVAEIQEKVAAKEAEEKRKIHAAHLGPLAAQVQRLETRRRIYNAALARVQDQSVPSKARPDRQLQRDLLHAWSLFGRKEKAMEAVTDDFNRVQRRNIRAELLDAKKKLLLRLVEYVDAELQHAKRHHSEVDNDQVTRDLRREALASPAMKGQLDHSHAHKRHVFDLPGMAGMNTDDGKSPPVKKLYEMLTSGKPNEAYAQDFIRWMHERYVDQDVAGLRAVDPDELVDRLVQHLREEVYLPRLREMNLFDLLDACCIEPGERREQKIEDILLAHLQHIGGLARELVAFEAQLWAEGTGMLSTSLYMGMSWSNGAQRRILDRARSRLNAVAREGTSPMVASAVDPHRLQLVYGQHAISMGTIPDFYLDSNSFMGEFLAHQHAWDGKGVVEHPYGQSKAPVFANGEMERLVMDPTALDDRRSLPDRIIRQPQIGAGIEPEWFRAQPDDSYGAADYNGNGHTANGNGYAPNGYPPNSYGPDGQPPVYANGAGAPPPRGTPFGGGRRNQ
jgi:hypothetical protein